MKHFKLLLLILRIVFALLFAGNVYFMVQLYNSIKAKYINDIEQCLSRAEQIELVDRIIDAGLGDDEDIVWLQIGLQKSDVDTVMDADKLRELGYSQGFRRADIQIMSTIAQYLHNQYYTDQIRKVDISKMEEAFRRDLNFSGFHPDEVHIVAPGAVLEFNSDLWEIEWRVRDNLVYYAYISPLTENILREMGGVIITSGLIALALTFGFWYLLHVISRQRSIEEMKDDLINNMTHELKTPIAIAYAANDSLLQFPDPGDEERTKKYLKSALEQLTKLSGLVENILAMSMERRKHLKMTKEKINLREILISIIEQQKLKTQKPCEITLDCEGDIWLQADPTHFSNAVGNLIDNSIKYSGDDVSITIKADASGLSVSDNGIGIPESSLPYLWSKFYRVPRGNKAEVRGYGIGLFYVKSIIDKHGWQISVVSRPGKGSTFTINF